MPSENQYLVAFKNDDAGLMELFYKEHWPTVRRYVIQNSGNQEDAKDIYQSAFLALYENIQKGKYTPSSRAKLSSYFIQICKYQWLDFLKSAHHRYTKSINKEEMDSMSEMIQAVDQERNLLIVSKMTALGERCQRILKMFYWDRYSMEDIALQLQLTKESAKNAKYRCLKNLKSLLKNQVDE